MGWLDLLTPSFKITITHNKWQPKIRSILIGSILVSLCSDLHDDWLLIYDWLYSQSQIQSYVTTDGRSASLSWNKAHIWGRQLRVCWCGALSLTRESVCRLQFLDLANAVILGFESRGTLPVAYKYGELALQVGGSLESKTVECGHEGGPVISPGTGFHFRSLLRLAGLGWTYSTPPPQPLI
jgi:hypothetical protein